jgi:hypothetical protein
VFESPVAAIGKKPKLSWTGSEKTEPATAVFSSCESVAVAVLCFVTRKKAAKNRFKPV